MGDKIIITDYKNSILTCVTDGKRTLQMNLDPNDSEQIFGNIYIGKVRNIVKNINAAFIEISNNKMCYYSLAEDITPHYIKHGNYKEVRVGDEFLVQVSRDEVKTKAPTVTAELTLTGKYIVLTSGSCTVAVSSKIEETNERKRLKKLISGYITEQFGFIIRTNAAFASEELILKEINSLSESFHSILENSAYKSCFSLMYQAVPPFLCTIRDSYSDKIDRFITDNHYFYDAINQYLSLYQREDIDKLSFYSDEDISLDASYHLTQDIEMALREKVWLKSGGSLIIQPTEALTAIDVNTEKAIRSKSGIQEMFFKINMEAAAEICYQMRLRNLSGIIIIDFIDMLDGSNRKKLFEYLTDLVKLDPIKTTVVDMTALNLIEITRKKTRKPLLNQMKNI